MLALTGVISAQDYEWKDGVVDGRYDEIFKPVLAEFRGLFEGGFDKSSQLAVYVGDRLVIDAFGVSADAPNPKYNADSIQTVFSSGKSVAAILLGIMADQGRIRYDAYVTDYWPKYG